MELLAKYFRDDFQVFFKFFFLSLIVKLEWNFFHPERDFSLPRLVRVSRRKSLVDDENEQSPDN